MEGKQVFGYELRRELGAGGMATVYYAENRLGKSAAVKVLKPELSRIGDLRQRFEQEARLMARLSHPNIRGVLDISEVEGCPAILMEYLAGQDLGSYVKQKGAIPVQLANLLWIEAVGAIEYAHSQGVIHRDIKPSNFFLTEGGGLKLLDFGIAKASDQLTQTLTGQQMGTILYMSPEQVKDPKRVGKETDYYSLGVTFYHLLTGRAPYDMLSESGFQIQMRIVQEDLDLRLLPVQWQRLLSWCLEKNPLQRRLFKESGLAQEQQKSDQTWVEESVDRVQKIEDNLESPAIQEQGAEGSRNLWFLPVLLLFVLGIIVSTRGEGNVGKQSKINEENASNKGTSNRTGGVNAAEKDDPQKKGSEIIASLEDNMVYVEGGSFKMGCTGEQGGDCDDDERPVHEVTLSGYYMGKYEVTQAEWRAVMGGDIPILNFPGCNQCPVESVSWDDAQEFIRKLNNITGKMYRLPTEAEWEFAARGGRSSRGYKYAGSNSLGQSGWYLDISGKKTYPVGQKQSNELGLYDMSGNVWEWCSDWYGAFSGVSQTNPMGSSAGYSRSVRGGGWFNDAQSCRVSNRSYQQPMAPGYGGFRLARSSS